MVELIEAYALGHTQGRADKLDMTVDELSQLVLMIEGSISIHNRELVRPGASDIGRAIIAERIGVLSHFRDWLVGAHKEQP